MFITDLDLHRQPGMHGELRTCIARLNHNAKRHLAPLFTIGEGLRLAVRLRKPERGAASPFSTYRFGGRESFRLDNVIITERSDMASLEISATFCPSKPALASTIASMTLPLSQAFQVFPGLEAWCEIGALFEGTQHALDQAHERAATELLPTVAEVRASPLWGVW
jgi:hypothetical protein